ncbi:MAG: DUF2093 domain-containing protein [Bauldia sp.]|nr:DUF2093 domain-containing protein [Bauldia sp.]MCW5716982.1 DUF2093 domain-containing protein [Bauldia sp.]
MNRIDISGNGGEARVRYLDGDFQVISPGSFVRCAVTGVAIKLDELRYWSVARQEAYVDAAASLKRHQETGDASARR